MDMVKLYKHFQRKKILKVFKSKLITELQVIKYFSSKSPRIQRSPTSAFQDEIMWYEPI